MRDGSGSSPKGRKLRIEYVQTSKLKPWKRNPRKNDEAVDKLAKLIGPHGFVNPIIATPDGTVRAGHTRLRAAQKAGLRRSGSCDSEVYARLIKRAGSPKVGIVEGYERFGLGDFACALLDAEKRAVWLWRDAGRPLWIAEVKRVKGLWFGSTMEILTSSIGADRIQWAEEVPPGRILKADEEGTVRAFSVFEDDVPLDLFQRAFKIRRKA